MALWGTVLASGREKKHILSTRIEHKAVLSTLEAISERKLADVTYLEPDRNGLVSAAEFTRSIRTDTILASVMYANNETGMIQPVSEIQAINFPAKSRKAVKFIDKRQSCISTH